MRPLGLHPGQALLESAFLANRQRHAADFACRVGNVSFDYGVAMKTVARRQPAEFWRSRVSLQEVRSRTSKAPAKLAGKNAVSVSAGKEERHDAKKGIVIATGSRVRGLLRSASSSTRRPSSHPTTYSCSSAPKTMAVIGAALSAASSPTYSTYRYSSDASSRFCRPSSPRGR